ncbi:MAG: YbaB/EbfC family nucleoid-associated protein [Acholeplasmataceae bacterium]|jgi:DNA-binding YbaB/EbfC family protein|nr:YbaB/EbfC family nucleoid-associated protein [Acholeplasmataceae bacterium]
MNRDMIKKLQKLQKDMQEDQEKIELTEFEGRASGCVVIMQGNRRLIDVQLSTELLEDIEILQEVIILAVNDALQQIDRTTEEVMGKYAAMGMGF